MEQTMYDGYNTNNNDDLCTWLQPYSKEELQAMVIDLAHADHAIYQVIMNRISTDTKWCKLFVHGLHPNTTKQSLARVFQQHGNLKEAVVLLEQHDRSKGCGFVVYETADSAQRALSGSLAVDGRRVQCDYAFKGNPKRMAVLTQPVISPEQRLAADGRRLFIHDLAWKTSNDTLRYAFQQYGEIQEAVVIHDRQTGKSKGFGFVTFTSKGAAEMALREPVKRIDGRDAKVAYAKATKDTSSVTPPYRPSPTPDSVSSGRYSTGSNHGQNRGPTRGNNREDGPPRPMLKRPSLDLINVSTGSNASNQSIASVASFNSYSMSSAPSYSVANSLASMPMFTPNQSVSNQWVIPTTQFQAGLSSDSAPVTPAETPVMLPMVACGTPPLVSLGNVMHPSMLLPPPSPNSLGIRSEHGQEFSYMVPVMLPQFIMQPPPQQLQSVQMQPQK